MQKIIQLNSPVLGAVTSFADNMCMCYIPARKKIEELAQEYYLRVADLPMTIHAINNNCEIREALRRKWLDTITGEYHGLRDGDRSYEIWHSVGSLSTLNGLEQAFSIAEGYGFMKIGNNEWDAIGKGTFNRRVVPRVHLEDVKKGNVPNIGTPYTVFVRLDKDSPIIYDTSPDHDYDQIGYTRFMRDDRILMLAGSPDNREALAKLLFGARKDGGDGWDSVYSYHRINEVDFHSIARGRLVGLYRFFDCGIGGNTLDDSGCFFAVNRVMYEKTITQRIFMPTASEQALAIKNDPNLSRQDKLRKLSKLY
ncbi:MAG: hypothetical protein KAT43_04800 [Nanoarchaeota archaeon]|nr:hypothetical protein [Nanoarchaeota archaeon]